MKKVLIVAPDFAPSSLPPALRVRFFASHLTKFGWEPVILSTEPVFYENAFDPENQRLLPESLRVVRTPAFTAKTTRWLGIGDLGFRSLWHHWRAMGQICAAERFDLVFIPVPPYVTMVLGRLARARFGIPYVIDYIDPWITEYYWKLPRSQRPPKWAMAYALSRLVEPFAVGQSSAISGVSRGTLDSVRASHPNLESVPSADIPYGIEPLDFEYVRSHPRKQSVFDPSDGNFHISYIGACIPPMYATVRALFRAVRLGLDREPERFSRVRLHFVGTSYAPNPTEPGALAGLAEEAGIASFVDERRARLPYLEALQVMLDSSALVAIGSEEAHYTASKIFPYLLTGKPLLAIFHEQSSVLEILRSVQTGYAISFSADRPPAASVESILQAVRNMMDGPPQFPAMEEQLFRPFTACSMAEKLAALFDEAVGCPRAVTREAMVISHS